MILAFIISFIAFLAFLDLEIKDRILFSLVFSIMISLIIITIYYLLGILLFLKMALYFTEKYNDKKNGYVIIFIPMILFFIARIFDWNTFLDKLFLNFYLFSGRFFSGGISRYHKTVSAVCEGEFCRSGKRAGAHHGLIFNLYVGKEKKVGAEFFLL